MQYSSVFMSTVAAAAPAAVATHEAEAARPPLVNEDWLAVLVGAALIGLVLLGARPGNPLQMAVLVLIPVIAGAALLRARLAPYVPGVLLLTGLAWVAQEVARQPWAAQWSLEYVIFALAIGLAINHTVTLPAWMREAVRTEYYIKTGLVVLGASILFDEIARAGLLGIAQALIVVVSVWSATFWLAKKMNVDDEFATMLSSAVSICGVSAAIATCGAIQGDKKKLSYVTSLVLVVAMPMMILMPWIAKWAGMPDMVAGAWLGGTLDTSAAVVAGGELISDTARDAAVVVKLSQNALIGFAALGLTIWWAMKNGTTASASADGKMGVCDCVKLIWARFPKFVFGFLIASLVFSFMLANATVTETRASTNGIRTMLFAMAFVSIGLETNLGSLVSTDGGRPALAFLGGQAFNIVVTLAAAYFFFGYLA
jgi:uncharacterized integral membrane protein (TIGR00698 family)